MELKKIIADSGFRFNKRYGQNFIDDGGLLENIVRLSGVEKTDSVVEIGAGGGTLTRALSKASKFVYSYEVDENLRPILSKTLADADNVKIIFGDFLRASMTELEKTVGGAYVVVANIPYYVTSPIVMRFIEEAKLCKRVVVMIQKEVADRFCSEPSTPEYGAITAAIDLWGDAKKVLDVDRSFFFPRPEVDSAVVRIDKSEEDKGLVSYAAYRAVVRAAFSSRRKTLANNLINAFKTDRTTAEALLSYSGVDVKARGETLSSADFIRLANVFVREGVIKE